MKKINVAIVGYGNIGKFAVDAVLSSNDMDLLGVVRRNIPENIPNELIGISVVQDIKELGKVDVAILCLPTGIIRENAEKYLKMGINTVDSFDIHSDIVDLKNTLEKTAKENECVSIVSAGWDPGSDSIIRALLEACSPKGLTYTNFGPGMSMGHTVAVKNMEGVKNALSVTIPTGTGVHRRMVYVEIEDGVDVGNLSECIKNDPYFIKDDTYVIVVDNIDSLIDVGHGVNIVRKGVSGKTNNQLFEFNMKINNPALTSQIMVSCARASMKQKPGVYTMIEIPMIDLLYGNRNELIKKLV